jgi:hypothetical protein
MEWIKAPPGIWHKVDNHQTPNGRPELKTVKCNCGRRFTTTNAIQNDPEPNEPVCEKCEP